MHSNVNLLLRRLTVQVFAAPLAFIWAVLCGTLGADVGAAYAHSSSAYTTPTAGQLGGITAGPDGNLWIAEAAANQIAKLTTAGIFTEYPAGSAAPQRITTGPDGNLWFTEGTNRVAKITTAGVVSEYPTTFETIGITSGPDGNVWFTEYPNLVGKVTMAGVVTEYATPTSASYPLGIVGGPDGNVWFTEQDVDQIGKATPVGVITEYPLPTAGSAPIGITAGSDGNLWFAELQDRVGKITTGGVITEYATAAGSNPVAATTGPDGDVWFTEVGNDHIGRITPTGTLTEFASPGTVPTGIAPGADGNFWITDRDVNVVTKLVPSGPLCATAPLVGCRPPAVAHKALLQIAKDASVTKNKVLWKWAKGSATSKVPDFGTPLTTTAYQLCIYDAGSTLLEDAFVPAGGTCAGKPCWSDKPRGFQYGNNDLTPEGIKQILLKDGADGKASIMVKGSGADLLVSSLPVTQPVKAQLVNSNGVCWEATYSSAKSNGPGPTGKFKANAD